jgi:hypothetical protein
MPRRLPRGPRGGLRQIRRLLPRPIHRADVVSGRHAPHPPLPAHGPGAEPHGAPDDIELHVQLPVAAVEDEGRRSDGGRVDFRVLQQLAVLWGPGARLQQLSGVPPIPIPIPLVHVLLINYSNFLDSRR